MERMEKKRIALEEGRLTEKTPYDPQRLAAEPRRRGTVLFPTSNIAENPRS
jgi:hypothetical protein